MGAHQWFRLGDLPASNSIRQGYGLLYCHRKPGYSSLRQERVQVWGSCPAPDEGTWQDPEPHCANFTIGAGGIHVSCPCSESLLIDMGHQYGGDGYLFCPTLVNGTEPGDHKWLDEFLLHNGIYPPGLTPHCDICNT